MLHNYPDLEYCAQIKHIIISKAKINNLIEDNKSLQRYRPHGAVY